MGRHPRPIINLAAAPPWGVPAVVDVKDDPDGDAWVRWHPFDLKPAENLDGILDAFVKLACYSQDHWRARAIEQFVVRWGTWGFCQRGDRHDALAPVMSESPTPPLSRAKPPVVRELVGELLLSASRLNALRRIVVDLRVDSLDHKEDWRELWGPARPPRDVDEQRAMVAALVNRWTTAAHLESHFEWSRLLRPVLTARIHGTSGALAIAFLREVVGELPVAKCGRCGTTFGADPARRTRCRACSGVEASEARRKEGVEKNA